MIEDVFAVMQRINELRSRFGLNRSHGAVREAPPQAAPTAESRATFEEALRAAHEGENAAMDPARSLKGKTVDEINRIADYWAGRYRVPAPLVKAVIENESGYNATAQSPKGAKGLMQLMPAVMKDFNVEDPYEPQQNIKAGVGLLADLLKNYGGDYTKALAAYNAGKRTVDEHGGVPDFPETKEYVRKVIQSYLKNSGAR